MTYTKYLLPTFQLHRHPLGAQLLRLECVGHWVRAGQTTTRAQSHEVGCDPQGDRPVSGSTSARAEEDRRCITDPLHRFQCEVAITHSSVTLASG